MITSVLKTLANNVKVVYRALINSDGDEINPATEDGNLATLAGTVSNQKVGVDIGSALVSVDLAEVDVDAILDGIAGSGTPKTLADLYATTYNDTATAGLADLMYSAGAGESVAELLYDGTTSAVDHLSDIAGDTDATRSYAMQISSRVGGENSAAATAGSEGSLSAKMRLVTSQLDAISTDIAAIKAVTDVLQFDGSNRLKVETTAAP